jgi:hypothetical protein
MRVDNRDLEITPRDGQIKAASVVLSPLGNSDTADNILKPWIAAEWVQSGIHPDPGHSSRALKDALL